MTRTRLLLVDDHVLFREGLTRLLACEPDCEVVGACGSCAEALQILKGTRVDVVLLDYDLNQDRAGQLVMAAHHAGYAGRILMVTAGMSAKESSGVLKLGVSGIILKHNPPRRVNFDQYENLDAAAFHRAFNEPPEQTCPHFSKATTSCPV